MEEVLISLNEIAKEFTALESKLADVVELCTKKYEENRKNDLINRSNSSAASYLGTSDMVPDSKCS